MSNEILEISQWLHEKEFECDMWYNENWYTTTNEDWCSLGYPEEEAAPYFTLNRAFELLRDHDGLEKYPNIHKEFLSILAEDDMPLAALRLLKRVVEEGYLNEKS